MDWLFFLCLAGTAGLYLLYERSKWKRGHEERRTVLFKGGATACCALLALAAMFRSPTVPGLLILAALCISTAADMILCTRFIAGMCCFGAAHLAYIIGFLLRGPVSARQGLAALILVTAVIAGSYHLSRRQRERLTFGRVLPFAAYACMLALMLVSSVNGGMTAHAAAILFVCSDSMIALRKVKENHSRLYDYIVLGVYYLAQFLFAASIYLA